MNDPEYTLEAELAAWQPGPVSPDLWKRIGNELSRKQLQSHIHRLPWFFGSAAAAACLLLAVLLYQKHEEAGKRVDASLQDLLPTLGAYGRALSQTPDALDQLLDRHAASTTIHAGVETNQPAFLTSSTVLQELKGNHP